MNEESEDDEVREGAAGENPLKIGTGGLDNKEANRVDQEDGSSKNSPSSPAARTPDPYYLVYAFTGCLFFSASGILRKYQGSNVLVANSIITLSFLVIALLQFVISAIRKKAKGEKYLFPWQTKGDTYYGEVVMTDKGLLFYIFIGGLLEFLGA